MVFVALDVASPALQGWRWFEHIPQGFGTSFTVSGKVVEGGNELMTLMANIAGLVPRKSLHFLFLLALALISIQDLGKPSDLMMLYTD